MEIKSVFYINGIKKLIFRKEGNKYITFNPIDLEFFRINLIGAEILFLISENFKYEQIVTHFTDKYKVSSEIIKKDIKNFLSSFGCTDLIKNNLSKLDIDLGS